MIVSLQRIRWTKAGEKWREKRFHRLVRIISDGWYWRPKRSGYTDDVSSAGVYFFYDAWDASSHCGPEKGIRYEFIDSGQPTQEPKGKAVLMLRPTSEVAREAMSNE